MRRGATIKTIGERDITSFAMVDRNERIFTTIVHEGRRKEWVGFGWVDEGPATDEDLRTLHVVTDAEVEG